MARLSARRHRWFAQAGVIVAAIARRAARRRCRSRWPTRRRHAAPVDGRRVGRVIGGQPPPHGPPGQGQRRGGQRLASVGSMCRGQLVEQVGVVAQQPGLAGQHRHQVALGQVVHRRQQLVADAIAQEGGVAVRRVVDDGDARASRTGSAVVARRRARMRPPRARAASPPARCCEAPRSRLSSMVSAWSSAVWPVSTSVGQHRVAGLRGPVPRGSGRRPRRSVSRAEVGAEPVGRRGHDLGLGVGTRSQAMVDVHRGDAAAGGDGQHQQRHRVGAARHCAGDLGAGRGEACTSASSVAAWPAQASANECPHAIEPLLRVADLLQRGQVARASSSRRRRPAARPAASIAAMNRSPAAYWLSLPSIPVRRSVSRVSGLDRRRLACSTACEPIGRRHQVAGGAAHGHVAVALEQRHQAGDPLDHRALLGRGDQPEDAAVADAAGGPVAIAERFANASAIRRGSGLARRRLVSTRPVK